MISPVLRIPICRPWGLLFFIAALGCGSASPGVVESAEGKGQTVTEPAGGGKNTDDLKAREPSTEPSTGDSKAKEQIATLAGGCFWCTEAVFERMKGVNDVVSGYIGGHVPNPTYPLVSSKRTGHAEAVEVYFDPDVVSYEEILEVFFKTHDPTTLNQQGVDYGPQYRSGVFFHNEEQRVVAKRVIKQLEDKHEFRRKIVTEVTRASRFWEAEEYHQDYFRKHPTHGYCRNVVSKKVKKFNNLFKDKKKEK